MGTVVAALALPMPAVPTLKAVLRSFTLGSYEPAALP